LSCILAHLIRTINNLDPKHTLKARNLAYGLRFLLYKIMPDTNTFDFLYENKLLEKLSNLIKKTTFSLVICRVQMDEIEKISEPEKKKIIQSISIEKIPTWIGWVGVEDRYNRGYLAPRVDWFKAVNDEDAVIVNKYRRGRTPTRPVGNEGDLAIVYTAIKEGMDYLVSDDKEIIRVYDRLKSDFNSDLKFLDNTSFVKMFDII